MFTRQHYKAVAAVLYRGLEADDSNETYVTVYNIAIGLAEYFEQDNPRFDRGRFMVACGMKEDD